MKKSIALLALLLALSVVFTACGGGGGGGGAAGGTPTGTFTKTIDNGANTAYTGLMENSHATARWQDLYLAGNIAGSGNITSISFQYQFAMPAAVSCPNTTIKLSHSNLANLTATFANNLATGQGGQTTVLSNSTMVFPAGAAGTWHTINFTTPFNYNGVDNLVMDFNLTSACTGVVLDDVQVPAPYTATVYTFSGAATGTTGAWLQDMKFNFAGGNNKVDFATAYNNNSAPLSTNASFQKVQMLYNASSIAGSGAITGIGLQVSALTTAQTYTYTMKLGHSSLTDLTNTYANNINVGSPITVASSAQFTVPAGVPAGDFIWIPIPGNVFTYNGTNNLVIELTIEAASGNVSLATHPTANVNRIYGDPANPTASTLNHYTHQIALRFNGGTADVITDGTVSDARFFPVGAATGVVSLFRATELGNSGTITSIACRAHANTVAGSYPSFRLVVGHTAVDTLTTPADFISQHTVYSGAYSIPGTLLEGDWIEIPLSTPFVYDGTHNLIVWMGATAADGTGANACSISTFDAVRYPDHGGIGMPGGASYGGFGDAKVDIRMKIQK